ncbi:hypothetical protein JAO76_00955 [Pontibacter sp. BT310]|uniref:Uncharacterized protein n=1 Tax=Pontibacter populi TaxID=890055 RepID=A0ABS6X6H5_9BACT|nr:hypothetical protein [Pontibacter sp. BT310]MBJ6116738.1 hypothetical protein [Pontibacter sp. BT310]MBR0569162.1 hypothetical protein [Microvirga sp. STS03]MBW3363592.1 hypothetical protein [Pontibacter populi]
MPLRVGLFHFQIAGIALQPVSYYKAELVIQVGQDPTIVHHERGRSHYS